LEDEHAQLAVGIARPGIAGFRSSHTEARAAQHLALATDGQRPVVSYRDVELLCLVSANDELTQRMVAREIGELCGADKNLALVRETALVYLTQRQNVEATAERLFVHKNTVRYRLARAEELLGHPLNERAAHVELALRHVAAFGAPSNDPA
jgi:DNA-binding PucR family transcriptional regulator